MHGSPPAYRSAHSVAADVVENTLTHPAEKVCGSDVRLASESEVTRHLLAEARHKAAKVKSLRFGVYSGGGMGGESSNFNILRCWQRLTPGTLEKAEFIYTQSELPALKILIPGWPKEQAGSKIQTLPVNGLPCDFIPDSCLTNLPIVPFSIVGSTKWKYIGNLLTNLRANVCLSLQPLHWEQADNVMIHEKSKSKPHHVQALEVPKDNHWPVIESDIMSTQDACRFIEHYMSSDPGKALIIKTLILYSETRAIRFGMVYGLLSSKCRPEGLLQKYLAVFSDTQDSSPVILYVVNNLGELTKDKVEQQPELKHIQFVNDFSRRNTKTFLDNILKCPLSVIWGGRVPKAVFEKMVSVSHLPVVMEGSNTAELCQSLGKPYLPVGMGSHPFSATPGMVERNGYLAALLLGYQREYMKKVSDEMISAYEHAGTQNWEASLDKVTDNHDESQDEFFPCPRIKDQDIKFGDIFIRDQLGFNIILTGKMLSYSDSNVKTCVADLIPAFKAGQAVISLKELPTHTRDERFQLIVNQIRSLELGAFSDYLEQQSAIVLREFIKQSTDKYSEVSEHCQKLKRHALAPENNTLIKVLSQVPVEIIT